MTSEKLLTGKPLPIISTSLASRLTLFLIFSVAAASSNPTAAKAAVKVYFQDIEDIYQGALKKKGDVVLASYDQSVKDLNALRTYLK